MGGECTACVSQSVDLAKRGHAVTVVAGGKNVSEDILNMLDGINVIMMPPSLSAGKLDLPLSVKFLYNNIKIKPDIIHLHSYRTFQNITFHKYAKQLGIPYILQAHGSLPIDLGKAHIKGAFDYLWGNKILFDSTAVLALTPLEIEQYLTLNVAPDKIIELPNGIDFEQFKTPENGEEYKRKIGVPSNCKIFLFFGRVAKIKGVEILLRAYAKLNPSNNDISNSILIVCGPDFGILDDMKKLSKDLAIEKFVIFKSSVFGPEKVKMLAISDINILPSFYDTFPMAFLEAGAMNKPTIVSDACGLSKLIKEISPRLVFKTGNATDLANNMRYLFIIHFGSRASITITLSV